MMSMYGLLHQIASILMLIFTLCFGHDSDDFKVLLRKYDTDLCLIMKTVHPGHSPNAYSLALQKCQWNRVPVGMSFSILALEPVEPVETVDDIKNVVDEHLIRISGSSCLVSGADNYSLKPGRCNVRSARFYIDFRMVEKRKESPSISPGQATDENEDIGVITNIYAFYFKQGGSCITDQVTGKDNYGVKLSPVVMSPCVLDNRSQMWRMCSTSGECSEIILNLFNVPLHPETTTQPTTTTTTTKMTTSSTQKTTTTTTENSTLVSYFPISEMSSSTTESNQPAKDEHILTVEATACSNSSLTHENSTCEAKSSSQQISSLSATVLVLFISRILL